MKRLYGIICLLLLVGSVFETRAEGRSFLLLMMGNEVVESDTTIAACDSLVWRGRTLTTSGRYTDTVFSVTTGVDSVFVLNLTLGRSTSSIVEMTICDSYTWRAATAPCTCT